MSKFDDQWVAKAMADDTLVADQLLRFRRHRPSLLRHWAGRQSRTPRLPVSTAQPARSSPTTPLTWTAATSLDGYEGPTRTTAPPPHSSGSKAVDQSETPAAKRSKKKRTIAELHREEKLKLNERKNLKDELAAMNITFEQKKAWNESLKRIKQLDLMSRGTLETGQVVLGPPPQSVEAHCDPSNLASAQNVQDKILDNESLVCAASASAPSNQQEIGSQEPSFVLPDLNLPPEEYLADFLGLSQ
ncbi:hypothetical protein E2542_SST14503 [Spatholobus suberectus]|nr:hypothetical protein E2542_SST14503 [Spatholobus suberectus]